MKTRRNQKGRGQIFSKKSEDGIVRMLREATEGIKNINKNMGKQMKTVQKLPQLFEKTNKAQGLVFGNQGTLATQQERNLFNMYKRQANQALFNRMPQVPQNPVGYMRRRNTRRYRK